MPALIVLNPVSNFLGFTIRKLGVPFFGVPITGILPFRVLYSGPPLSETPRFKEQNLWGARASALRQPRNLCEAEAPARRLLPKASGFRV